MLAAPSGTIKGTVYITSPLGTPTYTGTCADLTVIARSTTSAPITAKGTGDLTNKRCEFELTAPVGKWALELSNNGNAMLKVAERELVKGATLTSSLTVNWPTSPIGALSVNVDMKGTPSSCSGIAITVVHALRTFKLNVFQNPDNQCSATDSNIPIGPVTVSVTGWGALPPQTTNITTTTKAGLSFKFPRNVDLGVRLRPSDYPAKHTPSLDCTPYEIVLKKDGAQIYAYKLPPTTPSAHDPYECIFGIAYVAPANVPFQVEVKKNGAVVRTNTIGPFAELQHAEHVVPLP